MDTLVLSGTLIKGPLGATDCGGGGTCSTPITLYPSQKNAPANFEATKQVSAIVFTPLDGVGPAETVTQGTFLLIQTTSPMRFRITTHPDTGPDFTSELYVHGTYLHEFPTANYLALLEVLGTGKVHYIVAGNQ